MNLNKKHVVIWIMLLTAVWTGNIIYYQRHVLKEPLFIKNYYDIREDYGFFRLIYIDNINSERNVTSIVFPEVGSETINFTEQDYNSDNRYYRMKLINVKLEKDDNIIREKYLNKLITKAEVHLSDGKVINTDIGKIYISSNMDDSGAELFAAESTISSNNNTEQVTYRVSKDMKILSISSRFFEIMEDVLDIKLNKKPLKEISFPMELEKGDTLEIDYEFKFTDGDIRQSCAYDFPLYFMVEDMEGKKESRICSIDYWLQFPELYDINDLKEDRGIK